MAKISAWSSRGPGKFSSRADERVYRLTMDGTCDECGTVDDIGYHALIDGRILGLAKAGAILREDSNGFVSVDYYDDDDARDAAWKEIEDAAAEAAEDDD